MTAKGGARKRVRYRYPLSRKLRALTRKLTLEAMDEAGLKVYGDEYADWMRKQGRRPPA
jgi:hypothetical protein